MIETIINSIASGASISGVTLKDLITKSSADKRAVERYVRFLEGKQVLTAPFDQEFLPAVISSLEKIKDETERFRADAGDEFVGLVLLHLVLKMSEELMALHKIDPNDPRRDHAMYRSIQEIRAKFARALALLCDAFKVDLSGSRLVPLVTDLSFRPRRG